MAPVGCPKLYAKFRLADDSNTNLDFFCKVNASQWDYSSYLNYLNETHNKTLQNNYKSIIDMAIDNDMLPKDLKSYLGALKVRCKNSRA
jgi:hypothetical protein